MLLSLINKVTIFLHPNYVAAVRHRSIFNKKIIHTEKVNFNNTGEDSTLTDIVNALTALLKKPEWEKCNAQIVFSGHYTKFRVVDWNDALTFAEQELVVRHKFSEIYGLEEKDLPVFLSEVGFRKNGLAFVIDSDLYNAISNLEKQQIFKLDSVVPYFIFVKNYWHKSIPNSVVLIVKDDSYLYHARIEQNSWKSIRSNSIKDSWATEAETILRREMMTYKSTADELPVYFHDADTLSHAAELRIMANKKIDVLRFNAAVEKNPKLFFERYFS